MPFTFSNTTLYMSYAGTKQNLLSFDWVLVDAFTRSQENKIEILLQCTKFLNDEKVCTATTITTTTSTATLCQVLQAVVVLSNAFVRGSTGQNFRQIKLNSRATSNSQKRIDFFSLAAIYPSFCLMFTYIRIHKQRRPRVA